MTPLRELSIAKSQAFRRINKLAEIAHQLINQREEQAIRLIEAAKTVEEVKRVMSFVAIGDNHE